VNLTSILTRSTRPLKKILVLALGPDNGVKIGLRKAQIFRGQRGPLMEWRDNVRRLRVLGEAGTERKISRIKESASRKLVDLLVRDRSIGAVKVSGLRAVSSDPLRRHFSE
jgi:hypothetical protein